MNILVTGSRGRIGRHVVRELAASGHAVTATDRVSGPPAPGRFILGDCADAGDVYHLVTAAQADAVIHLGAWSDAGQAPDGRVFGDNVRGAFNVLQACADLGVQRVVIASSAQVYGFAAAPPLYVPVDESHPLRPANCYSLAKVVGEETAEYFAKKHGMSVLSFRFMGVRPADELGAEIDAIAGDPASGGWLLWTRTDARDAAVACRLAVEAHTVAAGPYNITGTEVVLRMRSAALVQHYFGSATEIRPGLEGEVSPLSTARAREAFGYRPRYVWKVDRAFAEADQDAR
jgi:nucleoside-diphosphate-sugar epimerase